ncbi:unnamed protein product [Mytilus coruscus]|uniref:DNA-directed DNA polymerase n=1 Tax=Mytilus coruscus TaxID=42192 RepID=A0A6J8BHD1_MYTCO|nr:unnamed protein product [Mytilus coruscus]
MPEPEKNILEFNNHHFKNRLPFVIYCDFEACNIPMQSCTPDPDKSYTKPISKQEINSYGMYVHSDYPEIYKSQYFHYDGDDVDKPILNKYEEDEFQEATECYICGKEFEENNKVREHDHLSGKYRGAACQSCNTKEDANNLYGWSMSKKLPTKDFKWEEDPDYYKKVPKGRGCLIKCDLKYTDKCKKKTIKYPLVPEKTRPKKEELSNYQLNLLGNKPLGNEEKLFLTGKDKKKYIVHYKVLKDYIKLGMKVTKVYKTISFKESDWLAKYINFNTEQRTKSKSDFEKDLWKLMNNSFYGKTLEDIRGRSEIKLLTDREEVKNI